MSIKKQWVAGVGCAGGAREADMGRPGPPARGADMGRPGGAREADMLRDGPATAGRPARRGRGELRRLNAGAKHRLPSCSSPSGSWPTRGAGSESRNTIAFSLVNFRNLLKHRGTHQVKRRFEISRGGRRSSKLTSRQQHAKHHWSIKSVLY